MPCSEKDFAGPQHQRQLQASENETNGPVPAAIEVPVPNSVDLNTAPRHGFLEEAVSLPAQTAPMETEFILSRFGDQTQPQNQRQASTTQENEISRPTPEAIEVPLPSSVDSSISMPGPRLGFLEEAISVSPPGPVQAASMETGSQSILSRLSDQKDMLRGPQFLPGPCPIPRTSYASHKASYYSAFLPKLEWVSIDPSPESQLGDWVSIRGKRVVFDDAARQALNAWPNSARVNQPLAPNPNSWVNRGLIGLRSAISTANEALKNAGNAINTAIDLCDSLLSAATSDTSSEGIYLSELILRMTSLDLKGAWSSVSEVWSKFMDNSGRMLIGLKIPGPDGFLGNYPIQSTI